jgi:N-acetylneuraminate synthase
MEGWDNAISADPSELEVIVREGKNIFLSLGSPTRTISEAEIEKRKKFRRSIVMKRAMKKGKNISINDIDFKRPGNGIHPDEIDYVIGRSLHRDLLPDHELEWSDLG